MYACGGIHTRICLGIREYTMNSPVGYMKLTQANCFEPWFQDIWSTFESLGVGGCWKGLGSVRSTYSNCEVVDISSWFKICPHTQISRIFTLVISNPHQLILPGFPMSNFLAPKVMGILSGWCFAFRLKFQQFWCWWPRLQTLHTNQ